MRLPDVDLDEEHQIAELRTWVTPTLTDLRRTTQFRDQWPDIIEALDRLAEATGDFPDPEAVKPNSIAKHFISATNQLPRDEAERVLLGLIWLLFVASAKADNSVKCQFPLHLIALGQAYKKVRTRKGVSSVEDVPPPKNITDTAITSLLLDLSIDPPAQEELFVQYLEFLLSDEVYISQLWALGRGYVALREERKAHGIMTPTETHLLSPLVAFKVRGSVAATGGHEPEDLLRDRLDEWGLRRGLDYNEQDVVVEGDALEEQDREGKERAYDFVLPYRTPGWSPRIFIQAQFYAGDSGSVSHKTVDQTTASRTEVSGKFEAPIFVEFVDGAGYVSSLIGDLLTVLRRPDTRSFFQIRTAPIRLRRELQRIGFLTPLELCHAVLTAGGNPADVVAALKADGYQEEHILTVIPSSSEGGWLYESGGKLRVSSDKSSIARRYLLLDVIAIEGTDYADIEGIPPNHLFVPGFGAARALSEDATVANAKKLAPSLAPDLEKESVLEEDLEWLIDSECVRLSGS